MKTANVVTAASLRFRLVSTASGVKPLIRRSVLETSLATQKLTDAEFEDMADFHGFSDSEIESARSRASSLYSEDFQGKLDRSFSRKNFFLRSCSMPICTPLASILSFWSRILHLF
jgi:hypothetical protein